MSRTPRTPTTGKNRVTQTLPPFPLHVSPAVIDWRDSTPFSQAFNDVYFSLAGGPAESRHVFVDSNDLPARFSAHDLRAFTIAETGFGTGLNFLVAAQEFLGRAPAGAFLHFVSVEKFPLTAADLERAHAHWPEFAERAKELRAVMPPPCSGFHHRILAGGRVRLTLLLGDADALLPRLHAQVDAWFLDGFAPAKNADLWNASVFAQIRRLSVPGATFATFTAAGDVKRGLADAGFRVEKVAGFGRKRDMLRGRLAGIANSEDRFDAVDAVDAVDAERRIPPMAKRVAIIGGGLAGCASARAFAERGWQVTLFERNEKLADETSGNLAGAVYPKFSPHETPQNRWYRDSYLFALARLPQILGEPDDRCWSRCGLLQTGTNLKPTAGSSGHNNNDNEAHAPSPLTPTNMEWHARWPADVITAVSASEASAFAGVEISKPGLWFAGAAWVNPPSLCAALAQHPGIAVHTRTAANMVTNAQGQALVNDQAFDAVVIANALAANDLELSVALPLRPVRGQVTHVAVTPASQNLRCVVCHEGYVTPARDGVHCIGATFGPRDRDSAVRGSDHDENLRKLASACPSLHEVLGGEHAEIVGGRTGFRTQTPDYLPVIGCVSGNNTREKSVFVLAALGAKGIAFSLLGAEVIAALANGEPLPVDSEVAAAIDPSRFQWRAQRKKQQQRPSTESMDGPRHVDQQ